MFLFLTLTEATELTTSVSRKQFSVGDKILFTVSAFVPKGATITPPNSDGKFGNIIIKEWNILKSEKEKNDSISVEYVLTTYTPENCTIPSLQFIETLVDKHDTLSSESIPLEILSVLPATSSDSLPEIKDLRPMQTAGKKPLWWLWVIVTAVLITALTLFIGYIIKRMRKPIIAPPPPPPYDEAITALAALHGKRFVQQGLIREYVFELSDIFKRYIGRRFEINAEEFTTEEIIEWIGGSPLETKTRMATEWFFRTTDPIKFAKFTPDDKTVERFGEEVIVFLELTKPQPEISKTEVATVNSSILVSNETPLQKSKADLQTTTADVTRSGEKK
jgi:hypothetical protein